jgi:hypothetical protein
LQGTATERALDVRLAHDGRFLYVRLRETLDPRTLVSHPEVWSGDDDWELLFAPERGANPYYQFGVNPDGKHLTLAYGVPSRRWESGARVVSKTDDDSWTVGLAFPLERLVPGGTKPGRTIYANLLRGGNEPLAWSPTYSHSFHTLQRMGEIVLE